MKRFGENKGACRCGLCDMPMGRKQIALRLTGMSICGPCFDKMMRGDSESRNERKENVQKEKAQRINKEQSPVTPPPQMRKESEECETVADEPVGSLDELLQAAAESPGGGGIPPL